MRSLYRAMHKITPLEGNLVRIDVSGKLTDADYDALIPSCEATIARHGSIRLLFVMDDFHGWEPRAAWDDFQFGATHMKKVERVAMVGDKAWQKWIAKLGSLFAPGLVKYFDSSELPMAEQWVAEK